jgi:aminoglycoside phosphotransferase (APT) family kinase protein
LQDQLVVMLRELHPDADSIEIQEFGAIAGGFSRETYKFDAIISTSGAEQLVPCILRKDPPASAAILETSREVEHNLIEAVRANTEVPVSQSFAHQMNPEVFGECAMIIERAAGNGQTSDLFNEGADADQVDDVVRHLCEILVKLHETDIATLNPNGELDDPRDVGIDTTSWDSYMDSTFEYYVNSIDEWNWDPTVMVVADSEYHLRRHKPRPMPLALVHGDFNPANFLYADGKVTALIDWENSRVGWMVLMDILSNTSVMSHPTDEGGFLAYYNKLRGLDITPEELGYFTLFGTINVAVPVHTAVKRRVDGENEEFLHLYLIQSSSPAMPALCQLMGYPGFGA